MDSSVFAVDRLLGFLLVLARISGVFAFVPVPGASSSPAAARVVLSVAVTFCLIPLWPSTTGLDRSFARFAGFIVMDCAIGIVLGLAVAFAIEAMKLGAQIAGLQAGFGFASTIDPSSPADSSLLLVIAELFAGLLFFAAGLDRQLLAILAGSLRTLPPGQIVLFHGAPETLSRLGSQIFAYGLRLAFPVIAFLLMVDLTLGFLGRMNAQLQLLTLAFPLKMMAAVGLFAILAPVYARVYQAYAQHAMEAAGRILLQR